MDNQDYLTDYRLFFDNFYQSFEEDNPLPVHIGNYNVAEFEIVGEVICWCLEYLNIRKCPSSLIAPLCRSVIVELEDVIRKDPEGCGYRPKEDDYQILRLMQMTIKKLNEVCLRYRDNSEVSRLPPPPPVSPSVYAAAVKNRRRTMEDSYIIIHDLHALFGIEGYGVASYYAVFDGHIGSEAALYSCSHLYQYLVESQYYPTNPEEAFKEAFLKTDERFIDKSNKENLKSGTTAVCILIRHDLGKMYVAWVGDSQAILVNGRDLIKLVKPHHPQEIAERRRIEALGGCVVFWGTWRVNGRLAVSRAIGDIKYKPYVSAEPDITSYDLSGDEDFLLLACDGLWDVVPAKYAVEVVYNCLDEHKGDRSKVSKSLVQAAKSLGSQDNISVVVAWLDMSTLENGHFVPGSEVVDSVDDLLLPPVLRSLKPATQTIAPSAPQRLDESAEKWLKTLPWSYADALRKPAPKKEEPTPPPAKEPVPVPASEAPVVESKQEPQANQEEVVKEVTGQASEVVIDRGSESPQPSPKAGEDSGDVGGEGDSGDDSDEEWNYISGKENREPNQRTKEELTQEEMESQLNPNAAEFVPVYGRISPAADIDIVDIAQSPSKPSELKNLDNVVIPNPKDFYNEISKRPSEIDDICEIEATLNGGDLNNLSTKAVFGDDSVCLNSAIDSSLVQNESLKSTNPFAPSQVPNFVQDHFSAPDTDFKPFNNDSKANDHEYDFMVGSDKSDLLSPSEPALEVYKSGQTDLSGIIFGDGVNVDDIVRSKQDSPLLRESPEPGLHNGQAEHDNKSPELENVTSLNKDCHKLNINDSEIGEEERSPSQLSKSPLPSDDMHEDASKDIVSELTKEPVLHSEAPEMGPETSVDSESDEDVLVSPKIKEKNIDATDHLLPAEDPVCSFIPKQDTVGIEKSMTESGLEIEGVYHKDDEDEMICPLKQNTSEAPFNSVPEIPLESMHLPESASTDVTPDAPSDFEIVHENSVHFNSEFYQNSEMTSPIKQTENGPSHPEVVEEEFHKKEVHEDLICSMKETPLLEEALKESFDYEKISAAEIKGILDSEPLDLIPDSRNVELEIEKSIQKNVDLVPEDKDFSEKLSRERESESEETLVCSVKKDYDNIVCSIKKDDLIQEQVGNLVNSEQENQVFPINKDEDFDDLACPVKNGEDLVCPIKAEVDFVSYVKNDEDLVCPKDNEVYHFKADDDALLAEIKKGDEVLPCEISKDDDLVCPIKRNDDDLVCSLKKEDDIVRSAMKNNEDLVFSVKREEEDESISPVQKEEDLICPFPKKEEDDLVCPFPKKEEQDLVCPFPKKEDEDLVCPFPKKEEEDLVCPFPKKEEEDLVCPVPKKEEDLVCPVPKKEEEDLVCPVPKKEEDLVCPFPKKEEDLVCPFPKKEEDLVCPIPKKEVDDLVCPFPKKDEDLVCPVPQKEEVICELKEPMTLNNEITNLNESHSKTDYEEMVCPLKVHEESVSSESKENISSEIDELVCPIRQEEVCSVKPSENVSHEVVCSDSVVQGESTEDISHKPFESHNNFELISPEKHTDGLQDNEELLQEDKLQKDESIDEMSSSMIDHGEDKSLPEAQSNQLDLVQDLQFNEAHEKTEADTESDSGFEIINASEASTIEMEMRIQSEKEAGAADEKLHLDKNEAEVVEKTEQVIESLQSEINAEAKEEKPLEPLETKKAEDEVVVNGIATAADTPATPPATPAPGLQVENKEGLIAAAVAAAGVATAVAAGTAAVKVAESKPEEKKKPLSPKKAEPATKAGPGAKPPISKPASGKPAAPTKAAAPKPTAASAKPTTKPPSPATKSVSAAATKPGSKPGTPTTKVAPKPGSKPSTPTGAKPATPTSSAAPKPKPSAPVPSKTTTTTSTAKPTAAAKATPASAAMKKPAPSAAAKPASTTAKPAVSSTVGARPASKPAAPARPAAPASAARPAASSTTKASPVKPPTPTATKAPTATRPPSSKTAPPSKPPTSSAPAKAAPAKPAPAKPPVSKPSSTTTSAKAAPAAKTLAAKPAAPSKTPAPISKKPAAPTAIKKPAAPTDKSVKEANNKLASTKTAVKKVEDKKIVSKKEEIAENEIVPPTQEPVVTTTNGHITLIENGISSPEIVAE